MDSETDVKMGEDIVPASKILLFAHHARLAIFPEIQGSQW